MAITVKNGNKKLISSGIINIEVDSKPVIEFDVDGLKVTLEVILLPSDSKDDTTVTIDNVDDFVQIKHFIKAKIDNTIPSSGMLRPIDFATRADDEDIYISWNVVVKSTVDNVRIAMVSYSFYDEV